MKYIQPKTFWKSFTCPHCGTIAMQDWWQQLWNGNQHANYLNNSLRIGIYQLCAYTTVWIEDTICYPNTGNTPYPNPEMHESVIM